MEDIQKILNKISLLKNLKERPGTPEEAAVAASKIQELMTKYNISVFQVDAATRTMDAGPNVIESERHWNNKPWESRLLSDVAQVNYVRVIRWSGYKFALIGHPHNVELVWNLYDYLAPEIDRLSREGWKSHTPQKVYRQGVGTDYWGEERRMWGYFPETEHSWRNNFRFGASRVIRGRLLQERDKLVEQSGASALMVIAQEEVDNAVAEWHPKLRRGKGINPSSNGGYREGMIAGSRINLAKQVGG